MIAVNETWDCVPRMIPGEKPERWSQTTETCTSTQALDISAQPNRQKRQKRRHRIFARLSAQDGWQFFVLWQIIGSVSAYDAFLAMKYRNELWQLEQNLLGRLLLFINNGDPSIFLGVKFLGTTMALGILASLYHSQPKRGLMIAKGVAGFQMLLAAYLTWA